MQSCRLIKKSQTVFNTLNQLYFDFRNVQGDR